MNTNRLPIKMFFRAALLLAFFMTVTGCRPSQLPAPTPTSLPTETPSPTATSSPTPTQTPTIAPTATDLPLQVTDKVIFSDTFDDNSNHWVLADFIKIENGLMHMSSGKYELAAIKVPLEATPKDVAIQVDIIPSPPTNTDPSVFLYGAGCRANKTGSDFYFFGVSPVPGVDGFFMATFMQFKEAKLIDYELLPIELQETQEGDGFTATFLCSDDNFKILDGEVVVAEVTNSDFRDGDLLLGLYQPDGIVGSVKFDNLRVSEIP